MNIDEQPFRPLSNRVTGPRVGIGTRLATAAGADSRLASAAFAPLSTKRRIEEAIEGGAGATLPLSLVHGFTALSGLFSSDLERIWQHGALTAIAILAYFAVAAGRSIWPSIFVLLWLMGEIAFGNILFGYRMGGSVLNWIAVPLAVLSVRAAWRHQQIMRLSSNSRGPSAAIVERH